MDQKNANFVAVVLSSYAKRVLETRYDELFKTELGERAKGLDPATKYLIEGGLYAALAYGDTKFPDDKPWKKFLFEVLKDAPSELSKRLINGVKAEAADHAPPANDKGDTSALQRVLAMDDEALAILMRWGADASEADFARIVATASELTLADMNKLDRLPASQRRSVLGVSAPQGGSA
jgi:hypothetical protein